MARIVNKALETALRRESLRDELARKIVARFGGEGEEATAVPGFSLYRRSATTACASATYMPRLVLFVQGEKRVTLGKTTYTCGPAEFMLTSVDLPVVSQVTKASRSEPIVGVLLRLEMPVIRKILSEEEFPARQLSLNTRGETREDTRGLAVGAATPELLGACIRLVDLLEEPEGIAFLSRLIQREIIYRLLRSPQGAHLAAIATLGEQSNRTARVVAWLRTNYASPLRVEELAEMAQMGVSTLHHHFRGLTAMSPLQYQKQLRLHSARERMLAEGMDAASAAYSVGYESASQFNREYSRFFGVPPMRDVKAHRLAGGAVASTV